MASAASGGPVTGKSPARVTIRLLICPEKLSGSEIAATVVTVQNVDADDDGTGDVDQILNPSRDLVLAIKDVGVTGDYHVVVTLFMEVGGQYIPVQGVDYMTSSAKLTFGQGKQDVALELKLVSVP